MITIDNWGQGLFLCLCFQSLVWYYYDDDDRTNSAFPSCQPKHTWDVLSPMWSFQLHHLGTFPGKTLSSVESTFRRILPVVPGQCGTMWLCATRATPSPSARWGPASRSTGSQTQRQSAGRTGSAQTSTPCRRSLGRRFSTSFQRCTQKNDSSQVQRFICF